MANLDIKGIFIQFADDATVLWHDVSVENLNNAVNRDLAKIKKWCDCNKLTLNVLKTSVMNFKCNLSKVSLGDIELNNLNENKFLGISLDNKLKFDSHIRLLCNKLASNCYALKIIAREVEFGIARNTYFALIESHLRYGLCFWGACTNQLFMSVFILQKRAIRYICKVGIRDSCRELFITYKILTLPSLFILETVCLIYKKYRSLNIGDRHQYSSRRVNDVILPVPSNSLVKRSFIFDGRRMFNHLPADIKEVRSNRVFRKRVKRLLVARGYYEINDFFLDRF